MNEDVVKGLLIATKPNCTCSISGWELAFETKDMRRGDSHLQGRKPERSR